MRSRSFLAPLATSLTLVATIVAAQAAPDTRSEGAAAAANQRGLAQIRAGDLKGAIASFSSAISLAPGSIVYLNNRALAYGAYGETRLAAADFADLGKLVSKDPNLSVQQVRPVIPLVRAPPGTGQLPRPGFDKDQPARIGLITPRTDGQTERRPANFDPGIWTRAQYDGLGRDMSMTNAIQSRAVAAYEEQRAFRQAEQAEANQE